MREPRCAPPYVRTIQAKRLLLVAISDGAWVRGVERVVERKLLGLCASGAFSAHERCVSACKRRSGLRSFPLLIRGFGVQVPGGAPD
jgi:hypothetical protein